MFSEIVLQIKDETLEKQWSAIQQLLISQDNVLAIHYNVQQPDYINEPPELNALKQQGSSIYCYQVDANGQTLLQALIGEPQLLAKCLEFSLSIPNSAEKILPFACGLNHQDSSGNTLLHSLLKNVKHNTKHEKGIQAYGEVLKVLFKYHAFDLNPFIKNKAQLSPAELFLSQFKAGALSPLQYSILTLLNKHHCFLYVNQEFEIKFKLDARLDIISLNTFLPQKNAPNVRFFSDISDFAGNLQLSTYSWKLLHQRLVQVDKLFKTLTLDYHSASIIGNLNSFIAYTSFLLSSKIDSSQLMEHSTTITTVLSDLNSYLIRLKKDLGSSVYTRRELTADATLLIIRLSLLGVQFLISTIAIAITAVLDSEYQVFGEKFNYVVEQDCNGIIYSPIDYNRTDCIIITDTWSYMNHPGFSLLSVILFVAAVAYGFILMLSAMLTLRKMTLLDSMYTIAVKEYLPDNYKDSIAELINYFEENPFYFAGMPSIDTRTLTFPEARAFLENALVECRNIVSTLPSTDMFIPELKEKNKERSILETSALAFIKEKKGTTKKEEEEKQSSAPNFFRKKLADAAKNNKNEAEIVIPLGEPTEQTPLLI